MASEDIKEDFLEVDSKIPGQNYVCLSFVSPEKVLKQKETFFVTKFLDFMMNDKEQLTQDIRQKMLSNDIKIDYDTVSKLYEDWKYSKTEELEAQFFEVNDYRTSMRGLKVRGVYDSYKEATVRAQVLRRKDPTFNVFVGQVGYWLPWDPECETVQEQEYQEGQLNELVKKYKENLDSKDNLYDQLKNERIEKARKEIAARKEQMKAQNENTSSLATPEEDVKNIEQLRTIVDESDKLYYDNLKAQQSSETSESTTELTPETHAQDKSSENLNNFQAESLQGLEDSDPWLNKKFENVV